MSTWSSDVWDTGEFSARLRAFVEASVGPTTLEPVRRRPWAAVWRATAPGVRAYAKQNCPGQAHEARLMSLLSSVVPERVVDVLAADPTHDLLLTADAGPTLTDQGGAGEVSTWCRLVAEAGGLQRDLLDHDLPLTVMEPSGAATYVADAVGRLGALPVDDPRRLDPEVARRLEALLSTVDGWAEEVEALGLPLALVHNDLHPDNVVDVDGSLRFFDFADAVVADPLGMLLLPLQQAAESLAVGPHEPLLWRVADAAIEVWSDLAPAREIREALPAALQLGRLARVESWRRCVATMSPAERATYGAAPAGWLASLLQRPPVVGRGHAA